MVKPVAKFKEIVVDVSGTDSMANTPDVPFDICYHDMNPW